MKDERYWPVLGTWLKDTAETPPDARQTAREVADRLPQTPQLRRHWWLPSLRRAPASRHSNDQATEHLPTATGRTRPMFSPVKVIITGALVFALGGLFMIAQPFGQPQRVVPGAESTEMTGARVTVTQDCDRDVDPPACTWTSSDPRLTGTFNEADGGGVTSVAGLDGDLFWRDATVEGEEGTWTGRLYINVSEPPVGFVVLSGAGAYEGWQYVATEVGGDGRHDEWNGIIYEGELPPLGPPSVPASE